jgi:HK97 family phage prohead protease
MKHMLVKATVTEATDQGAFTAVISTVSIDRDGDIVEPTAVVEALQKWGPLGKKIPLSWDHEYDADHIIGHIEPTTVHEAAGEVVAEGWIDQSFDRGKHAWRLVKSGTLGFSYGYLVLDAAPRQGGNGLHIKALDIFEVTATPIPANGDTRVLNYKSLDDLKAAVSAIEREEEEHQLPDVDPQSVEVVEAEPVLDEAETAEAARIEELEAQIKRLEREERLRKEKAIIPVDVKAQVTEAKDALIALEYFEPGEVEGMKGGTLKAVWTTAYINDLPDSAFLYVESGGSKDSEGKTAPRNLRHFPYKDANGTVDLPHLRNALARIPQSSLPQGVKDRLTARAQRILDNAKAVDVTDKEKDAEGRGSRSVDPLRKQADDVALEFASDGLDRRKPPKQVEQPKPEPEHDLRALRQRMFEETLTLLSE